MAHKPFIVSVELEIAVMAENEDEIREAFCLPDLFRDEMSNAGLHGNDVTIQPCNRTPDGWNLDAILYEIKTGSPGPAVTVKEALEMTKDSVG